MSKLNRNRLRRLIIQEIRRLNEDPEGDATKDIVADIEAIANPLVRRAGYKLDHETFEPIGGMELGGVQQYTKEVAGPVNDMNNYKLTLKIEYIGSEYDL